MAIVWGSLSQRAQLGIDVSMSPSAVTKDTSSVTLTWSVWMRSTYTTGGYSGTYALARTGTGPTGTTNVTLSNVLAPVKLWEGTQSVTTSHTAAVARTLTAELPATGGLFDGANPVVTGSFTVPKRPPQAPSAPTSVTETYVSDTRIDVSWVRPANANNDGTIWSSIRVRRWDAASGNWSTIVTLSGTATAYSDRTTSANNRYRYGIQAGNVSGFSETLSPTTVYTTPAAPSAVTAAKNSAGDIVVSWQDNSTAETNFEVQDETTSVGSPTSSPFTHVAPNPAATHRYRVRAVADGPRYSAWSAYSNTVQLQAAPAAPDDLAPNGATTALDDPLVLSWSHNPVDTTPQTAYELQHRPVGGSWVTVSGTTDEFRTVSDYSSQQSIEWQVRTKGAHVDWSPWSALATVPLTWRPTATLSAPGATVTTPSVTASWAYYHAGSRPQSGWEVQVRSGSTLLAQGSGSGTTSSWTSGDILPNLASASVRVRVRETSGLWSEWDEQAFTVNYDPPAESIVTAAWQDGYGNVLVTAQAVSDGVSPETVSHTIERSTDGGNTWAALAEELSPDASFIDWEAPAGGTYHYRISAVSALPSMAQTVVEVTVPATRINDTLWISGGPGFALAYALPHNPDLSFDGGRDRTLHSFTGRTLPVEFSARTVPTTLSVSATFMPDNYTPSADDPVMATRADLEDIFSMPGPHLYRDPLGRVLYGTVSALRWSREPGGKGSVSFTITRSAPPTSSQAASMQGYFAPRIAEVSPGVYELIGSDVVEAEPGVFEEIG